VSKNKRVPKELRKYVVVAKVKNGIEYFRYFQTQKEAKAWARTCSGTCDLFRINYDFYERLK